MESSMFSNYKLIAQTENDSRVIFRTETIQTMAPQNFRELINIFLDLISLALPVIAGLALLAFMWGLVKFISNVGSGGGEKAITEGKSLMVWGLLALFVMVSVWAIIAFFHNDLGLTQFGLPLLPEGQR